MTILRPIGVFAFVVLTVSGCSPATDVEIGRSQASADYALPADGAIEANSLQAFDVSTDGSVVEVSPDDWDEKNWDWGDQGSNYPSASSGVPEVEDILSPGYVVTGISARVQNSSFTRMRLHRRNILSNGNWGSGAGWEDWVRTSGDDGSNLGEQEIVATYPRVVVGLGMGISNQNVRMIQIVEREYSPSSDKLVGSYYDKRTGSGGAELYWDTRFITSNSTVLDKTVVVGVGLREYADNVRTMRVWTARLD